MTGWESIPIIYRIYSYFKKYINLKEKEKILVDKEKHLKNWEQEIIWLRNIGDENSKKFLSMIDFNPYDVNNSFIHAQDHEVSPYLKFSYSVTNHSIFDFKIKKLSILIRYGGSELGRIEISKEIDLPHQQTQYNEAKLDKLHPNFINQLKLLKKDGKTNKLVIRISEIEIDFIGDKEFHKSWEDSGYYYVFELEIPMEKVDVTL